jgi:hypothetical protein
MLAFEAELAHLPCSLVATVWEVFDRFPAMTWKPSDYTDQKVRGLDEIEGLGSERCKLRLWNWMCTPCAMMCAVHPIP